MSKKRRRKEIDWAEEEAAAKRDLERAKWKRENNAKTFTHHNSGRKKIILKEKAGITTAV